MQNLFVINSALSHRLGRAMATALVVVFWDVSLALACFFGAGALMDALPWLRNIVLGLGGLLVVCIGVGLIGSEADLSCDKDMNQPFEKIILASFVVTWLNPQAIVDGTIMLGAFRATLPPSSDPLFIAGFATASFIWFNALAPHIELFPIIATSRQASESPSHSLRNHVLVAFNGLLVTLCSCEQP